MSRIFCVIVIFFSIASMGCAGAKRAQPFNENALAPYADSTSHGAFQGHVQFDYLGVHALIEQGSTVYLTPVTEYTSEWYTREIIGGETLELADPRLKKYHRSTTVDSHGDYRFENLAPGDYYLTGTMHLDDPFHGNYIEDRPMYSRITIAPPHYSPLTTGRPPLRPAPSPAQAASPAQLHL